MPERFSLFSRQRKSLSVFTRNKNKKVMSESESRSLWTEYSLTSKK